MVDPTFHGDDRADRTDGFWHNDPPTDDQLWQMARLAELRSPTFTRSEAKAMEGEE